MSRKDETVRAYDISRPGPSLSKPVHKRPAVGFVGEY